MFLACNISWKKEEEEYGARLKLNRSTKARLIKKNKCKWKKSNITQVINLLLLAPTVIYCMLQVICALYIVFLTLVTAITF